MYKFRESVNHLMNKEPCDSARHIKNKAILKAALSISLGVCFMMLSLYIVAFKAVTTSDYVVASFGCVGGGMFIYLIVNSLLTKVYHKLWLEGF